MGMPEEGEISAIRHRFKELCFDLNVDSETEEDAWEAFERISHHYTLEGEPQHWLACSLYVSCRKTTVPTISGQEDVEGNCVSLTRLLRTTKLSLIDFFKKMKKWADMASLPQIFRDKVDRLERNFAVSTVIFSKFEPIFTDIFITPSLPLSPNYSANVDNPPKAVKGRKQKRTSVTVNEVFCFCWTAFVQVKGCYPLISDNLVNSYHLLLCCIDWIFGNILLSNRRDLLNSEFAGLPANYKLREYRPPNEPPCIINILCEKHEGLSKEAKCIKEHYWKPYIKKHFEKKYLVGNTDSLSKVLEAENFDKNCKSLNNMYEEYVLNIGDFDERIFLGEDSVTELGTPAASMSQQIIDNLTEKIRSEKALFKDMIEPCPLQQATPLTNRGYLTAKEGIFSPVSTATQSVSRLHKMLSGRKAGPTDDLMKIFSNCPKNPTTCITKRVAEMGKVFCDKYSQTSQDIPDVNPEGNVNFAKRILQLAESLYYLTLENIIASELKNPVIPSESKVSVAATILQQDELHRSLFAVSLEVVNFSYNSQKVFPWIVEILEIPVFSFYKVIEIVNRVEKGLSRDVVKHLNHVEEMILDNLVWRSDSALWEVLKKYGSVPTVEEVLLPSQFSQDGQNNGNNSLSLNHTNTVNGSTPIATVSHQTLPIGSTASIMFINAVGVAAPLHRPIHETFTSPVPVKRRLFDATPIQSSVSSPAGQETSLAVRSKTFIGKQITVQLSPTKRRHEERVEALPGGPPAKIPNKPKKTGSVPIFFRKVYYLASVRLRDLCDKLVVDQLLCMQIWTCIEHVFIKNIELLKDRHLDQIIMCCIYAICKVTDKERTFHDIMRCYRQQPQANSYVYRSVLLESHIQEPLGQATTRAGQTSAAASARDERRLRREREAESIRSMNAPLQTSSPTRAAGASISFSSEERGDLVKFYNVIFLKVIKSFAFRFHPDGDGDKDAVILSPLPAIRGQASSPRKVTSNVYVSPINNPRGGAIAKNHSTTPLSSNSSRLLYCFNKSPSRDLQAINNMIRSSCTANGVSNAESSVANSVRLNITNQQPIDQPGDTRAFRRRLHQVVTERHAANGNV